VEIWNIKPGGPLKKRSLSGLPKRFFFVWVPRGIELERAFSRNPSSKGVPPVVE